MFTPKVNPLSSCVIAVATVSLSLGAPPSANAENYYGAWVQEYDTSSVDAQFSKAVAMDRRGNVVVTGYRDIGGADRMYTAKYDALDGHLIWQKIEGQGPAATAGISIATDSVGNVIVTGTRNDGNISFYTVKYNGATGAIMWGPKLFDGTAVGGKDMPVKVVVDHNDDVIVTGKSEGDASGFDIVTLKYAKLNGDPIGVVDRFTTPSSFNDYPSALAVDGNNYIIVAGTAATGSGQKRFYVRKLNPSLGIEWKIEPINNGDADGAKGVAVDSNNDVIATGPYFDTLTKRLGFYAIKLDGAGGSEVWSTKAPILAEDTYGDGGATSVAVGPDDSPIVTGWLKKANGTNVIRTLKYRRDGVFKNAVVEWSNTDPGLEIGDSAAQQVVADGFSNAIIVGETYNGTNGKDIYFAKYDAISGKRVYAGTYNGTQNGEDVGIGVAVDPLANIAVLGSPFRKVNGSGRKSILTIKLNRFIAETGDELPDKIAGVDDDATYFGGGTPAISNGGSVVAAVSFKNGRKSVKGILHEGGEELLPAVQGQPAPVKTGEDPVKWVSFSDPVIAPDGDYAFAAKVTGKQSTGVWSNLTGDLLPALRKGAPVPTLSPEGTIASIVSYSIESNSLFAVVKVTGAGSMNTVLVRVDSANKVIPLLRTGKNGIDIGGIDFTVSKFSMHVPTKLSPGDGRWETASGVLVRASVFATDDKNDKREVLLRVSIFGTKVVVVSSGVAAMGVEPSATYKAFGAPSMGLGLSHYAFAATLNKLSGTVTQANDAALVYSGSGGTFTEFAREGEPTGVAGIESTAVYSGFSDPIINNNADVAFIGTLKGPEVGTKNTALIFGDPTATLTKIARVGDTAPAAAPFGGEEPEEATTYASFTNFVLAGGSNGKPVFLAKLNGAASGKNNIALFGVDSSNKVRRLLRTGDILGTQTVKSMTILKATASALSGSRNFNGAGAVTLSVAFTDRTTALLAIGIP